MDSQNICQKLMHYALKEAGPHGKAEVTMSEGNRKAVGILSGKPQSYDSAQSRSISLTVLLGQQQASASSEDFSDMALQTLAEQTVAMARFTPENKDAFLAAPGQFITDANARAKALDLEDIKTKELDIKTLQTMAYALEKSALGVQGVTKCKAVEVKTSRGQATLQTSEGFTACIPATTYVAYINVLAGPQNEQTSEYGFSVSRHFTDLTNLETLGRETGEKAVAKLGAAPIPSGQMPIVFDREVASDLLDMFAGAISGMAVDKGTTFLKDSMNEKIFSPEITIVDDPTIPRAIGSDPCDSDGIASEPLTLVEEGTLKSWLLSLASAKRLNLQPNGRADGTTNLFMKAGQSTPEALIKSIDKGLLVTGMIGHSMNLTTGDFSRGAEGFLIENGKITQPVSQITIASNLKDMFKTMTPANDLQMIYSTNAPTVKIAEMTVAGK